MTFLLKLLTNFIIWALYLLQAVQALKCKKTLAEQSLKAIFIYYIWGIK